MKTITNIQIWPVIEKVWPPLIYFILQIQFGESLTRRLALFLAKDASATFAKMSTTVKQDAPRKRPKNPPKSEKKVSCE